VANTIPGVGNGLESYTGILFGSVNLIKNTFGGIIVVVIIIICGVPYIKMQLYHFMMQFLIAAIQPVADQRMINGIQVACDSIGMLAGVIAAVALLFIVSIVIIGISTGMIR
jgi:stage III sporulation protein AE